MSIQRRNSEFFNSEEGQSIVQDLKSMLSDKQYITSSGFSTNTDKYKDNRIPFVEKHIHYLKNHPSIKPDQYLSNLRLMTKRR